LPLITHVSLVVAAISLYRGSEGPLFVIGAVSLLLLFIGIHNAWDTVVYLTLESRRNAQQEG
jgi:hypothetical protein